MLRSLIAGSALLIAVTAHAQDPITAAEVRAFFAPLAERAQSAVSDRRWLSIIRWFEGHMADEATIVFDGSVVLSAGPVLRFQLSMTGRDFERMFSMTTASPQMADLIENTDDYAMKIEVDGVEPLPDGSAIAHVTVLEAGTIGFPDAVEVSTDSSVIFEQRHECSLRLRRAAEDFEIALARCDSHTLI